MSLSYKQEILKNYLLEKLDFLEDDFFTNYIKLLEIAAPKYRYLDAKPAEYNEVEFPDGTKRRNLKPYGPFLGYDSKRDLLVPLYFNLISLLRLEVLIKSKRQVKIKPQTQLSISATDISNYTFCPVSYSISKSFTLLKLESAYLGTEFHKDHRLLNFIKTNQSSNTNTSTHAKPTIYSLINENNKHFFDDIYGSKFIYCGHTDNGNIEYFKSSKGHYSGQPDYLFENINNQKYVVEEKFRYNNNYTSSNVNDKTFFDNHINQVLSYMYGISSHNIEYGYLVYWSYKFNAGNTIIHRCDVLKITKTEENRNQVNTIYTNIKNFINNKQEIFNKNTRNPNKCANCVWGIICGHKTGKYNSVSYPYKLDYLKTKPVKYPDELLTQNNSIQEGSKKDIPSEPFQDSDDLPF